MYNVGTVLKATKTIDPKISERKLVVSSKLLKIKRKKTKLRVSDDKKIPKENEISVETNGTVKPAIQAVTGDHNYAFPKPLSDDSEHVQADLNSSRSSDSANAEPDDTLEDHWLRGYTIEEIGEMQKNDPKIGYILEKNRR